MTAEIRSGRSDAAPAPDGDVVVVGAGPIAMAVVARLSCGALHDGGVRAVPALPMTEPQEALEGARAVVLVADGADLSAVGPAVPAAERRAAAVSLAQRTVSAAREAGVAQVVAVTSAMVHGAAPGRAVIGDEEPPRTDVHEGTVGDLIAVEAVLTRAASHLGGDGPAIMVLRPAVVVGPGVDTLVTRHFAAPRVLVVRGVERDWQLVHVDDVAAAVELVIALGWSGAATVAAEPVLTAEQVERIAGMHRVELPAATAFAAAERLHRVGVLPAPAAELAYVVYPWTVDPARLRAAGWVPAHTGEECLRVLLDGVRGTVAVAGRPVGGREAALGAAGAAVALLGTAAVWRQARVRRYG